MGAGGKFGHILVHLWYLQVQGPPMGYYPDPTKIILVVDLWNVAQADEFFWGMYIRVVMGHRYLGGFIGDSEAEKRWLDGKVTGWAGYVNPLAGFS